MSGMPIARLWYQKALLIQEKALGGEHLDTAKSYNGMGEVYRKLGEYEKALEWCQKALAIHEKALGKDHPYTATTYNNIVRKILTVVDTTEKTESSEYQEWKTKLISNSNRDQKAGRIIGVLERYLTVILILLGQYTAVGFAFTAKSLTRFDKISKDQHFAEQYLIGTMSSLLFTLIGAVLFLYI
jgi:tetratricopeptide (TPR) repeat protein